MTCLLILAASFLSALCAGLFRCENDTFQGWWDREGIGWFVAAIPIWFVIAVLMGLPLGVSEGD